MRMTYLLIYYIKIKRHFHTVLTERITLTITCSAIRRFIKLINTIHH